MAEGTVGHAVALEVRDLEVRFASRHLFVGSRGDVRAVDGVSFHVDHGEVFCIAGESGCGKTTLGRALLGLVKPHSGEVSISGLDPARRSRWDFRARPPTGWSRRPPGQPSRCPDRRC